MARNKDTPDKKGTKIQKELSDLAKSLNIRVSSPYGYYPDDVDPIIKSLQDKVEKLEKENKELIASVDDYKSKNTALGNELSQLKLQVSLMEIPDISMEEGFAMLSRVDTITGDYNSESVSELKQIEQNKPEDKSKNKNEMFEKISEEMPKEIDLLNLPEETEDTDFIMPTEDSSKKVNKRLKLKLKKQEGS